MPVPPATPPAIPAAPAPLLLRELALSTETLSADAFVGRVGGWVLVGPAPSDSADDWSFRTLSAKKVFDATGDCDVMLDDNYVVHVLRKARPGPFANTILVGRSGTNDVCIAHSSISKLHARVRSTADGIWLSDAGSSNGTTLNGKKLAQGAEMPCSSGAHVLFGACGFQLFEPKHFHAILSRFRLI